MKKLVVPLAIVGMIMLLAAAVAWDCVRLASDGRRRVALADQELQKHERRLVKLLSANAKIAADVQSAIAAYMSAATTPIDNSPPGSTISTYHGPATRQARHAAYESVVASFRKTMGDEIDPTNPLDRKFMDDVAGAINRREIAEQQYNDEAAAYQSFLSTWRGRVARACSKWT